MYEDRMPEGYKSARECAIDEQESEDSWSDDDGYEDEDDDDQPDEAQEWESFDPDC